ncbi:nucleoside deaminase [candidate division WOR-3 bacterium]|nr:nucleoside deaminase [candidate division WOR-3 bacterium]
MREALREAKAGYREGETPVGAVVIHEGRIIGRGHNQTERLQDATAHAEMIAITAAQAALKSWRLLGCTLYVTVEPCFMCAGAALLSRIPRIVYGTRDPKFGGVSSLYRIGQDPRLNHTFEITEGLLTEEAAALMRSFFKKRRQDSLKGNLKKQEEN